MNKPTQINDPEAIIALRELCQNYIDYLDSPDYHEDNDYDHYIFEAALEAMFGKNVWDYINSKIK